MRFLTILSAATLLSTPVLAADLGTYRPGTTYSSGVAAAADVCEHQCAGDAQCRGWNYVKPNPRASGVCEFLSSVSTPIASQISISGVGVSLRPDSSRLSTGGTNTVRVGTQVPLASRPATTRQVSPTRRVVRESVPQRVAPQATSTRKLENMSLTEQQNRFRQAAPLAPNQPPQVQRPQIQRPQVQQRQLPQQAPAFRPILDGSVPVRPQAAPTQQPYPQQPYPQQQYRPQYQPQTAANPQQQRRVTGPRRVQQPSQANRNIPASQQSTNARPPIGQPIPASASMPRRSVVEAQPVYTPQPDNPVALAPAQASRSIYGKLHDDVPPQTRRAPTATPSQAQIPAANAAPTIAVTTEPMEVLAGGL